MPRPFLTARWERLLNVTWPVPPALLAPHVPRGVTLDVQEGHAFASLVAFDFLDTRVLGVPWPGFRHFPELNLRFYVKRGKAHGEERGVVFLREYVPQRLVAAIARLTYNEPYVAAPMRSHHETTGATVSWALELDRAGRTHRIAVRAREPQAVPLVDSVAHYFQEHRWGFGRGHLGGTHVYEVVHPAWATWVVDDVALEVDFAALYGPAWAFLRDTAPVSTTFAVGSPVAVYPHRGM
jgi:uncharacterized protein YqjF (DUF2071 family)